jgi:peptidoglycan/LPS O-acetylase OafA/YrhL
MTPPTLRHHERLPGIDALRGISILLVVAYHYLVRFDPTYMGFAGPKNTLNFPGWMGVDLFFMISGYCIALTATTSGSMADFLAKRWARIYPGLVFCAMVTFVFYLLFGLPEYTASWHTLVGNMLGLNLFFSVPHIDGAYWSLAVEVKFYLLFAIFFYVCHTPRRLILSWLAFCMLGWLAVTYGLPLKSKFIFPHSIMFLLGMMVYFQYQLPVWVRVACLTFAGTAFFTHDRYADQAWLFIGLVAVALHVLGHPRRLDFRPLGFIGLVSYSWYLVHQNVGIIIIREFNAIGLSYISIPVAMGATFAIAVVSYYYIEQPFRQSVRIWAARGLGYLRLDRARFRFTQ